MLLSSQTLKLFTRYFHAVAKSGPDGCYAFNEKGNARGNCHRQENNVYFKCAPE